ncbi:MAG TPA: hypothetical protein VKD28_11090 [Gemmatimonadales bacterium]|nr:hypothetical protein [Gemmatimonadales bacterium]
MSRTPRTIHTPVLRLAEPPSAALVAVSMKRYERSRAALRASILLLHLSRIGIAHGRVLLERQANKSGRAVSPEERLPQARSAVPRSASQPVARAALLVAFCLLTLAPTVAAQNAWVLERRVVPIDNPEANDAGMWDAQPRAQTKQQCESR